ncbi:uncharacterized protein LOC119524375 isoform X3 [Choloepus didactylus]|uniref:uncharacterized protein LOC119524375 isoform X3 n=1 Tax=Choloepus didactylus TaxID=27675 RepID=UPI00189E4BF3|nr:uncharacterized protein LOC119524375 isoform X3 [Choloepus didactylus]
MAPGASWERSLKGVTPDLEQISQSEGPILDSTILQQMHFSKCSFFSGEYASLTRFELSYTSNKEYTLLWESTELPVLTLSLSTEAKALYHFSGGCQAKCRINVSLYKSEPTTCRQCLEVNLFTYMFFYG